MLYGVVMWDAHKDKNITHQVLHARVFAHNHKVKVSNLVWTMRGLVWTSMGQMKEM